MYRSVLGKCPLPGKRPCTAFQGATVAASIQMYGILIPGKRPCGPKSRVIFKCLWALTRDTTVANDKLADLHVIIKPQKKKNPPAVWSLWFLWWYLCTIVLYRSVLGKRPLPGRRSCTPFQGVNVAAFIQTYTIYVPGKRPCGAKCDCELRLSAHGFLPRTLR